MQIVTAVMQGNVRGINTKDTVLAPASPTIVIPTDSAGPTRLHVHSRAAPRTVERVQQEVVYGI